ncbi:MAG TPA: hypothetical protein ACFYD7_06870 [Candidatus Wujingus californicus]|uniref:hypothetical protein n=1 Tax=Candidatus Wujingus californicus TaxID=3367618 RepID=UPI001D580777|nr:hypothetical protein [Planctomycetota bacterium]
MGRTLIIFEFGDEVESFISQRSINELRNENVCVLTLMPESQVYLKQLGIPFLNTCGFFGRNGHEQALLQSDRIYQFAESLFNVKDALGIKEGYKISFLFYTRLIVHYILWLIEVIERCCTEWRIEKIICCFRETKHIIEPFLNKAEGYAGEVVVRVAKKLDIGYELFGSPQIDNGLFAQRLKKNIAEIIKYVVYQTKFRFFKFKIAGNKIILAVSRTYNLGRVLDKFKHDFNNMNIVYLNNIHNQKGKYPWSFLFSVLNNDVVQMPSIFILSKKRFFKRITECISKIKDARGCEDVFEYKDINFQDIVFRKIKEDIVPTICGIYSQTMYLNKFLKKYKPDIIISQMARDINYNLGELASMYGIPSLLISHGSHVPPANEYEMIEWEEHSLGLINTCYRYIALQSPWAKLFIDKVPVGSEQVITGPLLFAKIDKSKKYSLRERIVPELKNKTILLYADTPRLRENFRFYVYPTVDEYVSSLNSLINAVREMEGMHLIIRFRPKYYLTKEQLADLLIESDCYSICSEGTFEDYLSIADMLVSYSSTTIEEALQNKVPVLLFDRDGKYCHIKNAQLLEPSLRPEINSCYYVCKDETLKWALQWLNEHHFSKEVSDSLWNAHVFRDIEKQRLTDYFGSYFTN